VLLLLAIFAWGCACVHLGCISSRPGPSTKLARGTGVWAKLLVLGLVLESRERARGLARATAVPCVGPRQGARLLGACSLRRELRGSFLLAGRDNREREARR
jgi:hypothetical protein